MAEQSKDYVSIVRSFYDAFNNRKFETLAQWVADEADWRVIPFGVSVKGKEGFMQASRNWYEAFPDGKIEIKQILLAGDWVIGEFVGRGTHTGPMHLPAGDLPPTGKRVEVPFCEVFQFRDGKLIMGRSYFDLATMLRQMGQFESRKAA